MSQMTSEWKEQQRLKVGELQSSVTRIMSDFCCFLSLKSKHGVRFLLLFFDSISLPPFNFH
jgi:hypothetical protein